jgi:hypothetical protein
MSPFLNIIPNFVQYQHKIEIIGDIPLARKDLPYREVCPHTVLIFI